MRMLDSAIIQLLREDQRYPLEAYLFVFEALHYAQNVLEMGAPGASEPGPPESGEASTREPSEPRDEDDEAGPQHHVTGQELCEAIRQFALEQYGLMAKVVLNRWGLHTTGDFGEIVFNLIRIGRMRKTPQDRREDFDDVFDFDTALRQQFRIVMPETE
jgi:uncharacterized repeat protein (TIGR04138 family)